MTDEKKYEWAVERLELYLKSKRMRNTGERYLVLKRLCAFGKPVSASELAQAVSVDHISRASVYNTIQLLMDAKIIRRTGMQMEDSRTLYEPVCDMRNHLRIVCLKCGRVAETRDVAVSTLMKTRKYANFNPRSFSLYIYGECKVCRRLAARNIHLPKNDEKGEKNKQQE